MAQPIALFQNFTLDQTRADRSRPITFTQDWIGIMVDVTEVTGTDAKVVFVLQWSNDGNAPWFESAPIGQFTAPGQVIRSMPIQACFWRLGAKVSGEDPVSITCSAHAVA